MIVRQIGLQALIVKKVVAKKKPSALLGFLVIAYGVIKLALIHLA